MKFCTECGTKNNSGAKFCVECGHSFGKKVKTSIAKESPEIIEEIEQSFEDIEFNIEIEGASRPLNGRDIISTATDDSAQVPRRPAFRGNRPEEVLGQMTRTEIKEFGND